MIVTNSFMKNYRQYYYYISGKNDIKKKKNVLVGTFLLFSSCSVKDNLLYITNRKIISKIPKINDDYK